MCSAVCFRTLDLYFPANIDIYEDGHLQVPGKVKFYNGVNNIKGTIGGVSEMTVIHTSMHFSKTSMTLGTNRAGQYEINNINVMAGGVLHFTEDITTEITLNDGTLHIAPTGVIKCRNCKIVAENINIEQGGKIDLDQTGYGTDGPGMFKPLVTNGFSHPYHLDESTFIFRGMRSNFSFFLFHFR